MIPCCAPSRQPREVSCICWGAAIGAYLMPVAAVAPTHHPIVPRSCTTDGGLATAQACSTAVRKPRCVNPLAE
jgi:hypothetical protein